MRGYKTLILGLGLFLVLGLIGIPGTSVQAAESKKPDIFVIMVDDHAFLQNERVLKRLPNIRKYFLNRGMRFVHLNNETPLCCPARANFFSGQHTLTNGIYSNWPGGFNHNKTVSKALDDVGYHTIMVGKYLNAYKGSVVPPGIDKAFIRKDLSVPNFWVNGKLTSFAGRFFDAVVKEKAVNWFKKAPLNKPVFEFVSPWAPHRWGLGAGHCKGSYCQYLPKVMKRDQGASQCKNIGKFKPPNYFIKKNRREWPMDMPYWPNGWPLKPTCESLLVVDRMVGQLVNAQKKRGRPAYFIFMSDNGMSWGQKSYPLKHVPTSLRLPFYVKGPGVKWDSTSYKLLSIIDAPVTIADIAGASMPWADGRSFLPHLKGQGFVGNDVNLVMMHRRPGDPKWPEWKGVQDDTWLYIRWKSGKRELFKYRKDPWMRVNRIKYNPGKAEHLDKILNRLIRESKTHPKFN